MEPITKGSVLEQSVIFHTTEGEISAKTLRGRKLVVYFYPKDDTPGCTTEGKDFTSKYQRFVEAGCQIIGVSKDSIEKHNKFSSKYGFCFPLASDDQNGSLCELFDVWKQKSMYGKTYMGIDRSTFVFDANGKCTHEWRKVKVPEHVAEVLNAVESI